MFCCNFTSKTIGSVFVWQCLLPSKLSIWDGKCQPRCLKQSKLNIFVSANIRLGTSHDKISPSIFVMDSGCHFRGGRFWTKLSLCHFWALNGWKNFNLSFRISICFRHCNELDQEPPFKIKWYIIKIMIDSNTKKIVYKLFWHLVYVSVRQKKKLLSCSHI